MPTKSSAVRQIPSIPALVVRQWLPGWDKIDFDPEVFRSRPEPQFYLFTVRAGWLKRLSQIYRRVAGKPRAEDLGIQRRHDEERSREIARFVVGGFPWSSLSDIKTAEDRYPDLRMPGWLPTAIVANILVPGTVREGRKVADEDLIDIVSVSDAMAEIRLPPATLDDKWNPSVPPLEIIDGQHRLWAFEHLHDAQGQYDLPVVAFHGLDIAWQAYLFYTINIKPKRINASLAFDLYPLLRTQAWLERFEGPSVYREARAQELTEALWSHPESPWKGRINMLGEPGGGAVTQASFVRSLMASYVKRWVGRRVSIGGLFGAELRGTHEVLPWSRVQQAAFLIAIWQGIAEKVQASRDSWARDLRERSHKDLPKDADPAFSGSYSLLATDQGVRGVLQVTNDLCYLRADTLGMKRWRSPDSFGDRDDRRITTALGSLSPEIRAYLDSIASELVRFDWRTSATPGLPQDVRTQQAVYRGSGGYRELRRNLLMHCASSSTEIIRTTASEALERLKYTQEDSQEVATD